MQVDQSKARAIFIAAVENHTPEGWEAFLDDECGENPDLRKRVEALLQAHQGEDSYLDRGDVAVTADMHEPNEQIGTQIGPYKLLQQIGEGGMGVVYMAEQTEPVKRRVALKVIKPGMDSRQVMARFEAERQALALMDHPNIARVLDAATTDSGRPYFVMELVKGVPVTRYCDEQHLSPKERLSLFIPVCQAVQHAHQKGIIHRDLKPSNVLVALYDGQPVPKVIDFGVAKATSQQLTDKTMFTQLGQVVGTFEYMSPEQAQVNQLDVDTRSDIYSLGVLLYELLTGATPFDRQRLRSAAFDEMMRIIREEDPPRPSVRLSTVDTLPSIAANRRVEPQKLRTLVRGDLDWIVMKALEKDRARRYETANGFAVDIQRYLDDEPVVACPPSASYRFRKFARRNRGPMVAVTAIMLSLVAGIAGATLGLLQAKKSAAIASREARSAEQANQELTRTNTELQASRLKIQQANRELEERNRQISQTLLHQALAAAMSGNIELTRHYLENAQDAGASEAQSKTVLGLMHWANGENSAAIRYFEDVIELEPKTVGGRAMLANLYANQGEHDKYWEIRRQTRAKDAVTAEDYLLLGWVQLVWSTELAVKLVERSLAIHDSPMARMIHAAALTHLALERRDWELANQALNEIAQAQTVLGNNHRFLTSIRLMTLGTAITLGRDRGEDVSHFESVAEDCALRLMREGRQPLDVLSVAVYYSRIKPDPQKAEAAWQRVIELESGDIWRVNYAAFVLGKHGPSRAIEILQGASRMEMSAQQQALLRALQVESHSEAKELWAELTRRLGDFPTTDFLLVALVLGLDDQVEKVGRDLKASGRNSSTTEYLLGDISEAKYLESPSVYGRYIVAVNSLRLSDRAKAKRLFRDIVESNKTTHWAYPWAEGFLAQLERDPNWPRAQAEKPVPSR